MGISCKRQAENARLCVSATLSRNTAINVPFPSSDVEADPCHLCGTLPTVICAKEKTLPEHATSS